MSADVYREGDTFYVELDVPGVSQEAIDVEVDKKTLTIAVDRPYQGSEERHNLVRARAFGSFSRRFFLGEGLDGEGVEAAYENGVLKVSIPVLESAQPRKIEVGTIRTAIEA
jgi:HSP20 family protein